MIRVAWVMAIMCGLAVGCGDSKPAVSQTPVKDALAEVGQMLKSLSEEGRRPPNKAAELEPVEPMLPTASTMIRDGTIVYLWGTTYGPNGDKIAAYEKKAETESGWVLLQNGTVKQMTADEFKAVKK